MISLKRKFISILLVVMLVLLSIPMTSSATQGVAVNTSEELIEAIANIPEGSSGEISVYTTMYLSQGITIENRSVVLNLISSQIVVYNQDAFSVINGNLTVNADDNSLIRAEGDISDISAIRIEKANTDLNFTLCLNGGKYSSQDTCAISLSEGISANITDAVIDGEIENNGGTVSINSGKFSSDISSYVTQGKWCGQYGDYFYVRDKEFSDKFNSVLTQGKVIFNYVTPQPDSDTIWLISEDFNVLNPDFYFSPESFNSDFSQCEITLYPETPYEEIHIVDIVWEYDEKIYEQARVFIDKFPTDREWFNISDLELVNYWISYNEESESGTETLLNFSGELKGYLNNTNFLFPVEMRGGSDDIFYTERIGSAKLMYNGSVYYASDFLGARAEHAIYVPESTEDTPEELALAAQKRIDDYIGAGKIQITQTNDTVENYYNSEIAGYDSQISQYENQIAEYQSQISECESQKSDYQSRIDTAQELLSAEYSKDPENWDMQIINNCETEISNCNDGILNCGNTIAYCNVQIMNCQWQLEYIPGYKQYFIDSFNEGGDLHFLSKAAGGHFFNVTVGEYEYSFVVIKDDTKLAVPSYESVDLTTNVQVNSSSSEIPLDTVLGVEKLTEGTEYDRVVSILNVTDNETYDIKLRSGAKNDYVTALDNGSFEVRLPIPESLNGKTLAVYYVDKNDNAVKYNVTVEDNFAVFITDHFSVYTLAQETQISYTIFDLVHLRNYLLGKSDLSIALFEKLDINADGSVTLLDLLTIKQVIFEAQ